MNIKLSKIFFCTGARNHDLLNYFKDCEIDFQHDERMASFKALGLSKISDLPVAICTTSGTAVAECIPALLEAQYSDLPLILISGDRPKKLHGTGSPQTLHHESLTRSCRGTYIEIELDELADLEIEPEDKFPIHINVLVDDTVHQERPLNYHSGINGFTEFISKVKQPLFLFSHENKSMRPFIEKFKATGLPFYAETLSGGRDLSTIKTEKDLINHFNQGTFDSVIRVGHTPLSKIWRLLEKKSMPVFHFDSRNLPALSYGDLLAMSSKDLLKNEKWWSSLSGLKSSLEIDNSTDKLTELIKKYPQSEISTFKYLHDNFQSNDLIYLGNSLVIRFFELVQTRSLTTFGNRGVNGIDGQLASAIGLAQGSKGNVYCILGDITTLYDLSSMLSMPSNLKLIIMNNKGGRIFDMLGLDKRIVMEHELNFEKICQGMGLTYSQNKSDFGKVQVLELCPVVAQSEAFLQEWSK